MGCVARHIGNGDVLPKGFDHIVLLPYAWNGLAVRAFLEGDESTGEFIIGWASHYISRPPDMRRIIVFTDFHTSVAFKMKFG